MKIVAFAGSNSRNSINKKLVTYASSLFEKAQIEILDLNDFELPLFGVDLEKQIGKPELAVKFLEKIATADLVLLSLAEHNGNYSVAFKNIFDWASRGGVKVFQEKSLLLMATSNGARGGKSVLEIAEKRFPFDGAAIKATFSLPKFSENFDVENNKISNPEFDGQLKEIVRQIQSEL
ncbi:MAG: NAD(P)H-dependent oxidoreductase [Flavobacteriaceae bacterium]